MPLALLLSPDDQAVSAITAVLEEMSVTCERPLDGVSAAQKLNSHSFDLVLVDCENLPAAKLIFDVCRRGKSGHSPVPIAIVDGRAGLPTAFRLGAELILTKPVAKDQARSTVRTAVSRVKREEPVRISAAAGEANEFSTEPATQAMPEQHALAAAAGASPEFTSYSEPVVAATSSAPAISTTMQASAPAAAPETVATPAAAHVFANAAAASPAVTESKPAASQELSDDPVLAELDKTEAEASAKPQPAPVPVVSLQTQNTRSQSKPGKSKQNSGPLVAVVALLLVGAAFYGAWVYEPGFKALALPQIDRVLGLVGIGHPAPHSAPARPAAQPAKTTAPGSSANPVQPSQPPAAKPSPAATTGSIKISALAESVPPSTTSASATRTTRIVLTAADVTASAAGKSGVNKIDVDKASVGRNNDSRNNDSRNNDSGNSDSQQAARQSNADSKDAGSPDGELPGERTATILTSKGAENRLIHSVQPVYPAGARPNEGTMVLKAIVDENGTVTAAKVLEGNPALANAAISAVKQWRYRPYLRDGKALSFQTVVQVDFQRP